jgi:DNA-binding transcriptional ArsR family regulator
MTDDGVRQVTETQVLAAMTHPLRRRIMDVLKVDGPSTVSALAGRLGQQPANVSHHLRVLRDGGLVEPAPDLVRDRRESWWRLVSSGLRWSSRDFEGDVVGEAAQALNLEHHAGLVRAWLAADEEQREAWGEGPFSTDKWLRLTPDELAELSREVIELFERWAQRDVPEDGETRDPVFLFAFGIPAQP